MREEDYKFPDLIVEFMAPSTEESDRETKRDVYQDVFRTREYFLYEPFGDELIGYDWIDGANVPKTPNERGWLWSSGLEIYLGQWQGMFRQHNFKWLRLYYLDGSLVPTDAEEKEAIRRQAEQAQKQAEAERRLREQTQAEIEQPKAKLREMGLE